MECISAAGTHIRPTVIFKGKTLQHQWFDDDTPDFVFTTSQKGWTHNGIGLGWLQKVFIPETRSETSESRGRILVLDGHASHVDIEFMDECHRNKILCIYLPPHTSHVLQPLDVAVFSALKAGYKKAIQSMTNFENAPPADKMAFWQAYSTARQEHLTERTIRHGFSATGICPINRVKGLESKFCKPYVPPRPTTPLQQNLRYPEGDPALLITPQNSRSIQLVLGEDITSDRFKKYMTKKVGKRLDGLLAQNAEQQQRLSTLQAAVDRMTKPKKRQAVDIEERTDMNVVFADKEAIRRDAVKSRHKRHKQGDEAKAQKAKDKVLQKKAKEIEKLMGLVQGK